MKILCLDDEPLALKMLETCVKQAKPEAEVLAFDDQDELLEEAEKKRLRHSVPRYTHARNERR